MNMMEGTLVQSAKRRGNMTGGAGRVYRYNTNGGIVTGATGWALRGGLVSPRPAA